MVKVIARIMGQCEVSEEMILLYDGDVKEIVRHQLIKSLAERIIEDIDELPVLIESFKDNTYTISNTVRASIHIIDIDEYKRLKEIEKEYDLLIREYKTEGRLDIGKE
jgi:adenylate kinase